MKTVNMHEAKTHLSKLVAGAVAGNPFVIARAGKPMVKVTPIEEEPKTMPQRLGFMVGKMDFPEWLFDPELDKEVERLFYGEDE
jgi:prevent-host-death family protein